MNIFLDDRFIQADMYCSEGTILDGNRNIIQQAALGRERFKPLSRPFSLFCSRTDTLRESLSKGMYQNLLFGTDNVDIVDVLVKVTIIINQKLETDPVFGNQGNFGRLGNIAGY